MPEAYSKPFQISKVIRHINNTGIVRTVYLGIFRHIQGHSAILSLPVPIPDEEKLLILIFIFTLLCGALCGALKGFIMVLRAFIKPFEAPKRNVKIKI